MTRERQGCDKTALFRKIQVYGFAMYDTVLFLDTHPDDKSALEYRYTHNRIKLFPYIEYRRGING